MWKQNFSVLPESYFDERYQKIELPYKQIMKAELIYILEIIAIVLGLLLALRGIWHQFFLTKLIPILRDAKDSESNFAIASWVMHGIFTIFCGVLSSTLLFFHGLVSAATQTALLLNATILILLAVHILTTGFRKHLRILRTSAYFHLFYGIYILGLLIVFIRLK